MSALSDSDQEVLDHIKIKRPKLYHVLLHNDDYTTMEFVIEVLERFFQKNTQQAQEIMLEVHKKGRAICGTYTFDIAEMKVIKVSQHAKNNGFPLRCGLIPADS
jgi:ATP-dependent Clp protease adaptor protein ClpS